MKKIIILLIIGLAWTFNLEAKKVEGKIFYENDTADIVLSLPSNIYASAQTRQRLQNRMAYFDSSGKKRPLIPNDSIKEIRFNDGSKELRIICVPNSIERILTTKYIFLQLEIDGKLRVFKYFFVTHNSSRMELGMDNYSLFWDHIFQKGDGELKRFRNTNKEIGEYLSDCPELVEKIESDFFKKRDVLSIVEYYNSNCK